MILNKLLLQPKIQDFIRKHYKEDVAQFILKGSPFQEVSAQDIATQLEGKKKAEKKLPTWFSSETILYPKKLNLAQTSSEITAGYKSRLVAGKSLVDITGGFGIDSFFFSKKIPHVVHCEINKEILHLAQHNFSVLNPKGKIEFFLGNGIEFLQKTPQSFDWIYIDPSRRTKSGKKVFRLEDSEPNILENLPLLYKKAAHILIKTSPLLDIEYGISAFQNVLEIHVVAVSNEVKELLWILSPKLFENEIKLKTVNFLAEKEVVFTGNFSEEQQAQSTFSEPLNYLYEPNSAILKSGMFNLLSANLNIPKLHPNSHLYTSENRIDFPGRIFRIQQTLAFKPKMLKKELKMEKANISTRNFPKSVEQLKSQLNLKDGGEQYLFFTTDLNEKKIVLNCEK
ncbi:MAG TPA: class I SAM-dependent methyltransferase [Flavobacteriaceae bacterium]|nr:class I SAM-dependent methyltransferase [Flavobacteriaceae bacterium]